MKTTVEQLARLINGQVLGKPDTIITGYADLREAKKGDISFLANKRYLSFLGNCKASAVVIGKDTFSSNTSSKHITSEEIKKLQKMGFKGSFILTKNANLAFGQLVQYFSPQSLSLPKGIHPLASVSPEAKLSKNVSIQPYVVIEAGAKIGANTIIYPNVYIGHNVLIGKDCRIYPNVVIREKCQIGNRVIIHSGTVIGSDGFGYATIKGEHHKIPQNGIVVIEDDVEIGANVTIDRARFGRTVIGRGTKIDNLVQIAHNVQIGPNSIIVAQTGISGSTRLGKNVTLAGQVGVVGHIKIGDNVTVAARSVVTKDIPAHTVVSGNPAQPHFKQQRELGLVRRLPRLYQAVKELQSKILKS